MNMKKLLILILSSTIASFFISFQKITQEKFQGKAIYMTKSKMDLGTWGARLTEAQKKQVEERLKNRLEKQYILTFNAEESTFLEKEKIDAISGATDSWGAYFSRGDMYKNIKQAKLVQSQEFYGKRFLVKDDLYKINWQITTETKKIGDYSCYKAMAIVNSKEIEWYNFNWSDLRNTENEKEEDIQTTTVEAWFAPQIPLANGPAEFWGLPGLILEVSYGNTVMLCTEININSGEKIVIKAPERGEEITKTEYETTIKNKMMDMRNNRMGRRSR